MKKILFLILLITLSFSSMSISLTPVKGQIILDGDNEGNFTLNVGSVSTPKVKIVTNSEFVFSEKEFYDVKNGKAQPLIKYKFDYDKLSPGKHGFVVGVMPATTSGGATAAVGFNFVVYKPINDYYAIAKIMDPRFDLNNFEGIIFHVENQGNMSVDNLRFNFTIGNESKNISFLSDAFKFEPLEMRDVVVPITHGFKPGKYFLEGKLLYADRESEFSSNIFFGDVNIDILNFTNEFFSGKINNLELEIFSTWQNPFDSVVANYKIMKGSEVLAQTKSPTIELFGWRSGFLTGFLDLTNIEPGYYNLSVALDYESSGETGRSEKTFEIYVNSNSFIINFIKSNWIILCVIFLFLLFLIFLRRFKSRNRSTKRAQSNLPTDVSRKNYALTSKQNGVSGMQNNGNIMARHKNYSPEWNAYYQNYYNQYYYNNYYNRRGKNNEKK